MPLSGSFGRSIERYEVLDDIVEARKSVQEVGLVDREGQLGLMILFYRVHCGI